MRVVGEKALPAIQDVHSSHEGFFSVVPLVSRARFAATVAEHMQRSHAIWRSRRGLKELDLLLVPFAEARYESLNDAQRAAYAELLECDDHDIWAWLSGREAPLE